MKAKLVYEVSEDKVVLEEASMEFLDQLTYRNFAKEADMFEFPRFADKISLLPKDGTFYISVDEGEIPITCASYLAKFGRNPFDNEQRFNVAVRESSLGTNTYTLKRQILATLADIDVFEEFHEKMKDFYTPQEEFFYAAGMLNQDSSLATTGTRRLLHEAFDGSDSYDMCRVFIDGLSNFESVKNKAAAGGKSGAPQFIKK